MSTRQIVVSDRVLLHVCPSFDGTGLPTISEDCPECNAFRAAVLKAADRAKQNGNGRTPCRPEANGG